MKPSTIPWLFYLMSTAPKIWRDGSQGRIWLVCTSTEEIQEGQGSFFGDQLIFFIAWNRRVWRLGRHYGRPYNDKQPQQHWRSSTNLKFFRGVRPQFRSFWSFDDKGGEIWVSLQAGLYYGRFLLSYNSRSSETFIGSSCNLKSDGALILLDGALCSDFDALCSDTFDVLFCMLIPR